MTKKLANGFLGFFCWNINEFPFLTEVYIWPYLHSLYSFPSSWPAKFTATDFSLHMLNAQEPFEAEGLHFSMRPLTGRRGANISCALLLHVKLRTCGFWVLFSECYLLSSILENGFWAWNSMKSWEKYMRNENMNKMINYTSLDSIRWLKTNNCP